MVRAKNYETMAIFVEVMQKKLWPLFFPDTVYVRLFATKTDNIKYEDRDRKNKNQIKKSISYRIKNKIKLIKTSHTTNI